MDKQLIDALFDFIHSTPVIIDDYFALFIQQRNLRSGANTITKSGLTSPNNGLMREYPASWSPNGENLSIGNPKGETRGIYVGQQIYFWNAENIYQPPASSKKFVPTTEPVEAQLVIEFAPNGNSTQHTVWDNALFNGGMFFNATDLWTRQQLEDPTVKKYAIRRTVTTQAGDNTLTLNYTAPFSPEITFGIEPAARVTAYLIMP